MIELKRHAPVGRPRRLRRHDRSRALSHLHAARRPGAVRDLYATDSAEARRGGGFRWFFSTCLAAAVGSVAILAAIFGASGPDEGKGGVLPTLRRMSEQTQISHTPRTADPEGLQWAVPKSDRLETTDRAMVMRYIVQESMRQRRGAREYIYNKPYARVVARLAAVPPEAAATAPPFNPIRLYGNPGPIEQAPDGPQAGDPADARKAISYRVVELLGSILPPEDGQELDQQEVTELANRVRQSRSDDLSIRPGFAPDGELARDPVVGARVGRPDGSEEVLPANTTVLAKSTGEGDEDSDDAEGRTVRQVTVGRGDSLARLLQAAGADAPLARAMVESARGIMPERELTPGHEVEFILEPSLQSGDSLEPVQFTVRDPSGGHRLTVSRNAAGELIASPIPLTSTSVQRAGSTPMTASSVYASLYHAARSQGVPHETIMSLIKVHAVDTDFRRRARGTDEVELFFDMKEEGRGPEALRELLYSSITVGGLAQRYYRFRMTDGQIDFFDENGNNSRKFLIRQPIRGDEARLTSGYGFRFHPLLNSRKMHTGVDWAAPIGTPILAAGTGVIEEAGLKGHYGNYIRIRHANGYQTAYAHMSRFAPGVRPGARVRQGQVIGAVGNTGFSTGPHLHYEVLVNNRFVDPLSIRVPREKRLAGRELSEFHKERARIDDLLRRRPVKVDQTPSR